MRDPTYSNFLKNAMPVFSISRVYRCLVHQHVWIEADNEHQARAILNKQDPKPALKFDAVNEVVGESIVEVLPIPAHSPGPMPLFIKSGYDLDNGVGAKSTQPNKEGIDDFNRFS